MFTLSILELTILERAKSIRRYRHANGTDALSLVLAAWGIGEGDAVFAPDFTFFATVNCAMGRGATPILVDIDERTFNMSPKSLEAAIKKTLDEGKLTPKVIIPVDLFGQCAAYPEITAIAEKYSLKILEDGAQGFGGMIGDRRARSETRPQRLSSPQSRSAVTVTAVRSLPTTKSLTRSFARSERREDLPRINTITVTSASTPVLTHFRRRSFSRSFARSVSTRSTR